MIYFLHGLDTYSSRAKLREIIAAFQARNGGVGFIRIDAVESPSAIFSAGRTASLFSTKELIVIERASAASAAVAAHIGHELPRWAEDQNVTVIFWEEKSEKKKASVASKIQATAAKSQEFKPLAPAVLARWLDSETVARGIRLSAEEKRLLLAGHGGDLWALSNELDKVRDGWSLHSSDRTALEIWDLTGAFLRHRRSAFLPFIRLADMGFDPLYLLASLGGALRTAVIIWKGIQSSRLKSIASRLHPFVVRKNMEMAKCFDAASLRRGFTEIVRADTELKTGRLPSPLPLLKLLLKREPKTAA